MASASNCPRGYAFMNCTTTSFSTPTPIMSPSLFTGPSTLSTSAQPNASTMAFAQPLVDPARNLLASAGPSVSSVWPNGNSTGLPQAFATPSSNVFANFGVSSYPFRWDGDSSMASQSSDHAVKRHLSPSGSGNLEEGEPTAKRKVDRMNASFRNFHISLGSNSGHEAWKALQKPKTLREIEDRLSDSSEEEMVEDSEKQAGSKEEDAEDEEKKLRLSELLREYIKRAREQPLIPSSPPDRALVPYVPRNPLEDPTMRGRINEISDEEADRIARLSDNNANSSPLVEDFVEEREAESSSSSSASVGSARLSVVELSDDSEDNDFDMDIDNE